MTNQKSPGTMPDIPTEKALREAALTVGTAFVIATGIILYLVHPYTKDWPALIYIVPIIMALPALLLLPLVRYRYASGPPRALTPKQHIARACLFGCLAGLYVLGAIFHRGGKTESLYKWAIVGGWLATAIDNSYRALRKPKGLPESQ
jgi:RsiW-degrading membrane proteinase PrsW (M82 family)